MTDATQQRAGVRLSWDEGRAFVLPAAPGALFGVEPEASLASGRIRTVAGEAMVGEDREDVAGEADVGSLGPCDGTKA